MNELTKIRDVATKYDISARTLRYYEDMGLIKSIRSDDYSYRMYDEAAIGRLEQILILRKLNISIKDIQRIFNTAGSEVVLEVLGKKIDSIDEEVSLLYELKEIVLDFIRQIEQADFGKESDVKLLYEKAKEIETQIVNVDYNGNPSGVNRLFEIADKIDESKTPDVRIVRLPKCKVATSGEPDSTYTRVWDFSNWWSDYNKKRRAVYYEPLDFLYSDNGFVWLYMVENDATSDVCGGYEIIDFGGGLYAVHNSIDADSESHGHVNKKIESWIKERTKFEIDWNRPSMGHMLNGDEDVDIKEGLGFNQMELFIPVKLKEE
ncbi:MAG: MerR family transcriptional regulator [Saccharofermentanales bacterium]